MNALAATHDAAVQMTFVVRQLTVSNAAMGHELSRDLVSGAAALPLITNIKAAHRRG